MGEGVNQNISTNSRQKMTASEMLKYLDKQPTKNDSQRNAGCLFGHKMGTARETHSQSRISMSRPQQKGMTSPFLT